MDSRKQDGFFARHVKLFVALATISISSSGILIRLIDLAPLAIGFWRLGIAAPFFGIWAFSGYRQELKQASARDLALTTLSGFFLFIHFTCWFSAVKATNMASAATLAALHPLVVLLVSVLLFREKVGRKAILGILLTLSGAAIVAGFDYQALTSSGFRGDLLALLAAVFMGFYFSIGNVVRKRTAGMVYVFIVFLACWLCFGVAVLITKTPVLPPSPRDLILLMVLTFVCQIGSQGVFNLCIGYVSSLYVSTWNSGNAAFAVLLSILILGQMPTLTQAIGCLVVITGLLYYNYQSNRQSQKGA
ncbi:MAG: DMT family transporter [Clostridia bacterium]|nr:DMT family transporter [Clostridia bacterium]